jgi:ubiquitin-conjugating enzyme E2 variant
LSFHHQICTNGKLVHRIRLYCSTNTTTTGTTTTIPKSKPNVNQLITEPRLAQPPIKVVTAANRPRDSDTSLQSTWSHHTWVAVGCVILLISLGESIKGLVDMNMWVEPILTGWAGYIFADLGSGIYHWAIDNYGDESTPLVGSQIEAAQGHHKWPWTITKRQFANNSHALARGVTFVVLPIDLVFHDPLVQSFVVVCAGCIMFSQQFHAWAHGTKSRLPLLVVALQEGGVLVSRSQHSVHHRPPYNNGYCIVSGVWNDILDKSNFFEAMEMILYFKLGVRPSSWSDPASEWIEESEIASQSQAP